MKVEAKHIPPEVIKAMRDLLPERSLGSTRLRYAIAAGLAAWPEAEVDESQYGGDFIILPLPQEASDV